MSEKLKVKSEKLKVKSVVHHNTDIHIYNHFEEGCNCQIFDAPIKDSVFIMAPPTKEPNPIP